MRITPNPFHLGTIQPLPQPAPVDTTEILGWTFIRPPSGRFDIEKFPGY